jgi:hypothetical protein
MDGPEVQPRRAVGGVKHHQHGQHQEQRVFAEAVGLEAAKQAP